MSTISFDASPSSPPNRATSIRRASLFLLVCSPLYLAPALFTVAHPALMTTIVLGLTVAFLRWDGRPLAALGLDPSTRRIGELVAGLAGGALLILVAALGVRVFLPFPWVWNPSFALDAAAFSLLWLLCGNAVEELVFRGYSFERLIAGIGHWPAQLVTALLFAVFHVVEGWPWQVALAGTTVGSLLFGMVFVRWRSVPAAIGVHAAGNFVRELLLTDPPTARTLLAPLSPRPWTSGEQITAALIMDGLSLIAAFVLWRSSRATPGSVLNAPV